MPLLTSPRQNIRLVLPDVQLGTTTFKQVAYVVRQSWEQPLATGEVSAVVVVQVRRFALDPGQPEELGVELVQFNPPLVRLIGTNDTLLAADTGEVVAQRTTETPAQWADLVQATAAQLAPRPVIRQGDALELLREQPVAVAAEIRRHLGAAPAHHWAPKDAQGQPLLLSA